MDRIVCFGETFIDLLARPRVAGQLPSFEQHAGGAPANVAVAVSRLGGSAGFVGAIANDGFGDFLVEALDGAGVATDCVVRTGEARTALAFVTLDSEGERSFSFYRPPAADLLFRIGDFHDRCFSEAAVFHACSNSLTAEPSASATLGGLERAGNAGAIVSFDVNLRTSLWSKDDDPRERIRQAAACADIVKLCRRELLYLAEPLGGEVALIESLWEGRARLVVVTDGAGPIRYYTRADAGRVPAFAVEAVDSTAAGDAFMGGLLQRLVRSRTTREQVGVDCEEVEDALRYAAACGALAVTRFGAFSAMPDGDDVRRFLQSHG